MKDRNVIKKKVSWEEFIQNKCKDAPPIETITEIRKILKISGIFPVIEETWGSISGDIWWVHLVYPCANIFTNGKGSSPEFALASAYGEFMERLQNQVYFFVKDCDFDEAVYEGYKFFFAPDEKYIKAYDLFNALPTDLHKIFRPVDNSYNDYLYNFANETPENIKAFGDFITIPYFNLAEDNLIYLPLPFIKYYYGTNGMCAGNTPQEAIVQGICEVFERYVNRETLFKKLSYPTVSDERLKKCERLYMLLNKIEAIKDCKIIIKDCFPITNLPVLCVILVDKKKKGYFVKFGAHPIFEIALERSIAELFQGRSIDTPFFTPFEYLNDPDKKVMTEKNVLSIFSTGIGAYPINIFYNSAYSYCEGWKNFSCNDEILNYLLGLLKGANFRILIRDVSFYGFPSYHIIIPKMSEFFYWNSEQYTRIGKKKKVRMLVRRLHECSEHQLLDILNFIEDSYEKDNTMDTLLGFPVNENFPLAKVKFEQFLAAGYYRINHLLKSHYYTTKYIKTITNGSKHENRTVDYYKAIRDYLATLLNKIEIDKKTHVLKEIYGEELIQEITNDLASPNNVFQYYPKLACWNCNSCDLNKHCYYPELRDIFCKIKEQQRSNLIDQYQLRFILRKYWK